MLTLHVQHAHACENLLPFLKPNARVLDVGSGSGYLLGVFHHLVQPNGVVVGIDHIKALTDQSKKNLRADSLGSHLDDGSINVVTGDGRQGYTEAAPYDVIHVGAAAPMLPQPLVDQLAKPGRMFIPIGDGVQAIWQIDKDVDGQVTKKKLFGVSYIPLTDPATQQGGYNF